MVTFRHLFRTGLAVVLVLTALLPGCILVVDDDDLFDDRDRFRRSYWSLEVLVYYGRTYRVEPGLYTLGFDTREAMSGYADCNDFDGAYEVDNGRFFVHELYATEVACGSGSLDGAYLEALYSAYSYALRGDHLTLTSRRGDLRLVFERE